MRTSKNRSSRARYTCAGWATGRSGWVAVLLCFTSLSLSLSLSFSLYLLALLLLPSSFHLPTYPARFCPFYPATVPLCLHRCRSLPWVVVRLFYYFYKCRRYDATTTTCSRIGAAGVSFVGRHHAPIVACRKMRILIWYCLILFMYAVRESCGRMPLTRSHILCRFFHSMGNRSRIYLNDLASHESSCSFVLHESRPNPIS